MPARANGTWPTPPGSSNASCWPASHLHRRMTLPGTTCSTATTRASARRMPGRSVGCCRGHRCSRCATTASRSMHRCNRGWRQATLMSRHCSTCSWACSTNSSTRNCCSPTSSTRSGAIRCSRPTARTCSLQPALPVRRAGSSRPSASSPSAPQPGRSTPPSPTTTNRRRIACCSPRTHWPSAPSAMPSTAPSSTPVATANRAGGSAKAGRCAKPRAGSTRCTGMTPCSASTPWAVGANWIRMRRSATSATTRPMPAPAGPVRACPASSSGRLPPQRCRLAVILPMTIGCTRRLQGQWTTSAVRRCMGMDPQRVWRLPGLPPFRRQPR